MRALGECVGESKSGCGFGGRVLSLDDKGALVVFLWVGARA